MFPKVSMPLPYLRSHMRAQSGKNRDSWGAGRGAGTSLELICLVSSLMSYQQPLLNFLLKFIENKFEKQRTQLRKIGQAQIQLIQVGRAGRVTRSQGSQTASQESRTMTSMTIPLPIQCSVIYSHFISLHLIDVHLQQYTSTCKVG